MSSPCRVLILKRAWVTNSKRIKSHPWKGTTGSLFLNTYYYLYRKSYLFPERSSGGQVSSLSQSLKSICQLPQVFSDPKLEDPLHARESPLNFLLFVISFITICKVIRAAFPLLYLYTVLKKKALLAQSRISYYAPISSCPWTRWNFVYKASGLFKTLCMSSL